MKTLLTGLLALLLLAGCGNNDYDGENGLISGGGNSESLTASLQRINDDVLIANTALLADQAAATKLAITALQSEQSATTLTAAQDEASTLFRLWKRVEAFYIADSYDNVYIDTPTLMDPFHVGNIDIPERLEQIFAGTSALSGQLYQSATRSVVALEYTLYGDQEALDVNMTQRRADAAAIMINYLIGHIDDITDFHASSTAFVSTGEDSVGIVINQLIDSIYKLREWRIGDPAGYTVKYQNDPDPIRLEYYASQKSLENIREILQAQLAVFTSGLTAIASENSAASEAQACVSLLQDAITQTGNFSTALESDPASAASLELYNIAYTIQTSYTALINALNFQQDIIEADGD